jgi:uncharacterized protein
MMAGKFVLSKATNGKSMFNLKAGNGQVILTSQMYESEASARNGVESVKKNATIDAQFSRETSAKGEPYFTLKANNGQVIGRSEMYSSASAMENGIASVAKNAPTAEVVEA